MKQIKRFLALLLSFTVACAVPVLAAETESNTLPPIYVGVQRLENIPESWNPLEETDADQKTILRLTGETLYRQDETGTVVPAQATELPVDLTAVPWKASPRACGSTAQVCSFCPGRWAM